MFFYFSLSFVNIYCAAVSNQKKKRRRKQEKKERWGEKDDDEIDKKIITHLFVGPTTTPFALCKGEQGPGRERDRHACVVFLCGWAAARHAEEGGCRVVVYFVRRRRIARLCGCSALAQTPGARAGGGPGGAFLAPCSAPLLAFGAWHPVRG
jgi:hypothetical protein